MSELSRSTRVLTAFLAVLAVAGLAACSGDNATSTTTPKAVVISAGNSQTTVVGGLVAVAPSVLVTNSAGAPLGGVDVVFAVTAGGGSISAAAPANGSRVAGSVGLTQLTIATNASGIAALGSWTLGPSVGVNTLTGTVTGLTPVTFTATSTVGAAANIAIHLGNNQSAAGGAAVAVAPSVVVTDALANPVSGVTVTFAIGTGSGSLTGGSAVSDANGIAAVGSWTLGATAGANSLTATSDGLTGSPVTFNATATAGAAAKIALNLGNGQTATVATAVAAAPSVVVKDVHDNPVAGYSVTFVVASGGGSVTGATVNTDGSGVATVGSWTLGGTAGANSLTVTAAGLTGSPVTFTATGTVGSAATMAVHLGNGQNATVATSVAIAPSVIVTDGHANPVSGVTVDFAVATGGGSVSGGSAVSDANGIATVSSWTLGNTAGSNTLTATATGLTNSPITFTATGTAGDAATIALQQGGGQTATVATAVSILPAVLVTDAHANPVSGVSVTFTVATGGGNITGGSATTDVNGLATVGSWELGTTAGSNSLRAASTGLTGSPVTFTATGTAGAATQIAMNSGDNQSATRNTNVAIAPTVIVKDVYDNPVSGVEVTFEVWDGGGSIGTAFPTTNASGIASVGSWTMGNGAGANHLHALVNGLTGSPVTFTATSLASAAAQIAVNDGNNQSAYHGATLTVAPSVIVKDAGGNPVSGVSVTFAIASGGGALTGASATSGVDGVAAVGSWRMGNAAGTNTMTATAAGLTGSPVTFTATSLASSPTQMASNGGTGQSAVHGTAVAVAPSVIVKDNAGNPVSGVSVTFAVASGGGSITGGSTTSNASGIATVGSWTLGSATGANSLTATSTGLTGSPVTFTATSTAGAATQIAVNAGNSQTAAAGTAVAIDPSVIVADAAGNPVAGVSVTFAVASGGGSVVGGAAITNASGIATVTSWTLGAAAGANSLTATAAGLTGSPVTFTATATATCTTQHCLVILAGNNQHVANGGTVAIAPSVQLTDGTSSGYTNHTVVFTIVSGGGSLTGGTGTATVRTFDVSAGTHIATLLSWTVGNTTGTHTVTAEAFSGGTSQGPAVTFTATSP